MHFSNLGSIVLAAASAISFVKASPFFELDTRSFGGLLARDLSGSKCAPFQYGAKYTPYGEVCVSIAEGFLTVKYPDMPNGGNYSDLHVSVQTSAVTEDNQGKWPYTKGNGFCTVTDLTTASCKIPVLDSWRSCGAKLYIGVHASFSLDGTSGNTGWMEGTCISTRQNCPRYFTFTTECKCPVVTEYEPLTASTEIVKATTIYSTSTVYCTSTPAAVTATEACSDPYSKPARTMTSKAEVAYTCPTPPA